MPGRRKKADTELMLALACGATPEQAAQKAGVSLRTVYRRQTETAFRAQVEELRAEMLRRTAGMLTAAGLVSVKTLWEVKKVNPQSMIHLTEKPVELAARAMAYSSQAGDNVLDLFGGSGSTLIAAEQTGRRAFLMEIDALYCDVIVQRWENYTGKKAQRLVARVS
jgi:hypothetical protein